MCGIRHPPSSCCFDEDNHSPLAGPRLGAAGVPRQPGVRRGPSMLPLLHLPVLPAVPKTLPFLILPHCPFHAVSRAPTADRRLDRDPRGREGMRRHTLLSPALPPRGRNCGSARRSPPSKCPRSPRALLLALPALRIRRGRRGRSEPMDFICPRKGGKRRHGAPGAPACSPHPDAGRPRSLRSREPHRGQIIPDSACVNTTFIFSSQAPSNGRRDGIRASDCGINIILMQPRRNYFSISFVQTPAFRVDLSQGRAAWCRVFSLTISCRKPA